ncbi:hypothetical protein VF14_08745 [Nostoc linckia z18]|uniref:SWIM-type domain-containing protein n=2 Tax=Nostoc linckia TaxID=92942 RepID=A0A9Q5ZEL7_NOSLI|nr:hypothetical protein [Nostoc linckia]PHK42537.1 hypothetical protein VF12_02390 [Nostoc linckia z15]PHK44511.1 hypothetical protein VF13_21090 [Nostoc linckia z16]PHJ59557.1 hypothetical protein VF02_24370 [Nostoc linckia z1]PHJ65166.1 hypothetical protein VF05_21780 [Nostoc linckia z3]PHJ69560.1 hypothetical protein VF03_23450 [Nostoc linckia z2]
MDSWQPKRRSPTISPASKSPFGTLDEHQVQKIMTHPIYTEQQLTELKLGEIKAIASRMSIAPEGDKRNKNNWVSAIIKHQNSQTQKVADVTQAPQLQPTKENPFTIEEAAKSDYVFSWAGVGNFLTIKGYNEQGMVVVNDGCDDLHFSVGNIELMTYGEVAATKPQQIDGIVMDEQAVVAQELDQYIEEQADDYLFHDEAQSKTPTNLPVVGDTHLIGDFLLRCAQIGGDWATVWDVSKDVSLLGEIRMGWGDAFWTHTMSFNTFATPQEAVIDLYESLQALLKKQQLHDEEAIAFEKVADGVCQGTVNGVRVKITAVQGGYKTNLTEDVVFADYDTAIMQSLVAVAKLQKKRLLDRTQRAATIQIVEQQGDKFVVQNGENGNRYIVRPDHLDPNQRCECGDCRHRGSTCKHQIAVENFLKPSLANRIVAEDRKDLILYSYEKNSFVSYEVGDQTRQATIKQKIDDQFYLMDNDDVVGEFQIICAVA